MKKISLPLALLLLAGTPVFAATDPAPTRVIAEDEVPSLEELEEMGRTINKQMPEAARVVRVPQAEIDALKATKTEAEIVQHFGAIPVPVKNTVD